MTELVPARGRLSAATLAFSLASFALFFRSFALLEPASLWWHLAVGDVIQTWQLVPDQQLFLATVPADTPWFYTSWSGEFLLASLFNYGGGGLVLLVHNLLVALTVFIITYILARQVPSRPVILLSGLFAALTLSVYMGVAPWSFAMPLMAVAIIAGLSLLRRPRKLLAIILPVTVLILTNLDLTSAILVVFLALAIALKLFQQNSPLPAAILALSPLGLCSFVYGPAALLPAMAHLELGPAAAPAIIFLTFILANRLSSRPQFSERPLPKGPLTAATLLVLSLGVALQPGVPTRDFIVPKLRPTSRQTPPLAGVMRQDLPLRCAEGLRASGKELHLFADPKDAGFLLFHIQDPAKPAALLFQDHRPLLPKEITSLLPLLPTEPIARGVFQQFEVNAAVVSREEYPALVQDLELDPTWRDLQDNPDAQTRCFLKAL